MTWKGGSTLASGRDTVDEVLNLVTTPLTMTDAPQAIGFAAGINTYIWMVDLSWVRQVRLKGIVATVSASVNTPKLLVKAFNAFSQVATDYTNLGVSSVEFSLFTGSGGKVSDTGWIDLNPVYRQDTVWIALLQSGGDGAADPVVNSVQIEMR